MEQSLPVKLPIFVRMRHQRSNARWLSVQLRPAQLPDGSHGLCFYRYEMRPIAKLLEYLDFIRMIC